MMRHLNYSPQFDIKLKVTLGPDETMSRQILALPAWLGGTSHTEFYKLPSQ